MTAALIAFSSCLRRQSVLHAACCRLIHSSSSASFAAGKPGSSSPQISTISTSQDGLCNELLKEGLLSERAARAMKAVDRSYFVTTYTGVPEAVAYHDTPVPIACGQHMDSPSMIARFLTLLEPYVQPGGKVLDVGSGSGYITACLASLAAPGGVVLALEKQAKLVARCKASIKASNRELLEAGAFDIRVCNAMAEPAELQGSDRFHAIHVGASVEEVPCQFVQLLKPGGRMVLPVGSMHGAAPQVLVAVESTRWHHHQERIWHHYKPHCSINSGA